VADDKTMKAITFFSSRQVKGSKLARALGILADTAPG